jgi:hypothetical protein
MQNLTSRTKKTADYYMSRAEVIEKQALSDLLKESPETVPDGKSVTPMQLVIWLERRSSTQGRTPLRSRPNASAWMNKSR